ncbi:MAG: glycosyltransferase [Saprospiraceae bacterium]|nr:glycosyltransferase [Saprospiraceae bacterium]
MKLSIIIVNYNVKYFLEQVLLSVRKASRNLEVETWVVDNNSVDDSVEMVQEKFPEVKLIANKQNVGFSKANNQAIHLSSGKYVLLLNPDTVVEEDTFEKCIAFMDAHEEAGGLGVRMMDGSGKFLPESKRGFPTPWVAFCKTFGLSSLFPISKLFNHYHVGYLPEHDIHEIEVLAGAFMLLRRSVLDKIGLLDESFFMYGEDIDLSYRIIKAGYKNYYFPDTTIIHYKGESTKKGSLNYVRVFYQAMIIFAKKHFQGNQANLFVFMLQVAIYFRAFITLISNVFQRIRLPFLDAAIIYTGLVGVKIFWANYYYKDPNYFKETIFFFNFPLYTFIWLVTVYFSGGYDESSNLRRLIRGLLVGTVIIAAVYGFLDLEYRSSRAVILLGAAWAIASTVTLRILLHFIKYHNFNIGKERAKNLVILGSKAESERVEKLLQQAQVQKNLIGIVSPETEADHKIFLGGLPQLGEVVQIYKIEEIIFCSKDVASQQIMQWMSQLGSGIDYKILPEESLSIIGSSSKNSAGELYTIDIRFRIADPRQRRNKRTFDLLFSIFIIITLPFQMIIIKNLFSFLQNIWSVLIAKKTWVGYAHSKDLSLLPKLKPGVLATIDGISVKNINEPTAQRLNFLYAKDYQVEKDLEIIWRAYRGLGKSKNL